MSVFDDIRSIPFEDIAKAYGIAVTRNHTCRCPFHQDGHPSMKLYPDHGYCFACNTYTDGAKLVSHLYGLRPIDGAKKIANDFGIAVHQVTSSEINLVQQRRQEEARRKEYAQQAWRFGCQIADILRTWAVEYCPVDPEIETLSEKFCCAIQYRDYVDYCLDEYLEQKDVDLYQWVIESNFVQEMRKIAIIIAKIGGEN